jgi:O-antigen/teichoic acid export membrane protein
LISKQITKNFLSLFLSSVVAQLFTLWAFVHIAGVFGPEGFGKFAFAQVVSLYFLHLSEFGLQTYGTRSIAQEREQVSRHVWDITLLRIVLALISFGLLVIFSVILPRLSNVQSIIIVFGLSLLPSAVLFEWVFQGIEQMKYVGVGRILKGVIFAGLVFLFVRSSDHLNYAAAFYVLSIVVAAGALFWIYCGKFGFNFRKTDHSILKNTLIAAIPLAAGSFITQINYNFGTLALGFFVSDDVVGLFSAAYKIVLFLWAFAVVAASNAILPLLARAYKRSLTEFSESLKKLFRLFVFVAIPIGIGGTILAARVIGFLYSPEYQKAVIVFQISIWLVVIVIYRAVFENALIASKNKRIYFVGYAAAGGVTILGNLLLVPVLGLVAPPIVGIVSESALLIYFAASCKFIRSSFVLKTTVKPLMAGLLMGSALLVLSLNLFIVLAIGMALYFLLLLLFRCLTIEEVTSYVR